MDKTKMITRITVICTIILTTRLNAVYTCTTTEEKYAKRGENVILQFQAVTTNPENSELLIINIVKLPSDSTLLAILYQDGSTPTRNPTCNRCTFVGDTASGDISIRIDNLQTANAGTYRHSVLGQAEDIKCITVYVLGVPEKPTLTNYNNNVVGLDTKLTCSSKSTTKPAASNLRLHYTWNIDNQDENRYVYSQYKDTLTINHLMKSDFKNFTCRATESGDGIVGETSLSSKVFVLVVIYGPDTATTTLIPANLLYIRSEGDILDDITCYSDIYPRCAYRWTKSDSRRMVSGHTLSLAQLTREENANFTCTVTNANRTEMTSTKTVSVIVRYGPDANTTKLSPSYLSYTKIEGEHLNQVTCSGSCVPSCGYKWTKPGATGAVFVSINQVLSLGVLNRPEAANYTCTVSNPETGEIQTKQIAVHVIYGPDSQTTILSPSTTEYTIAEGTILPNISCVSDCFPACSYKWTIPGNKEVAGGNILSLGTLTRKHAAVYTCKVTNTQKDGFVSKSVTVNVIHISFFVNGSEGKNEIIVDEYNDVQFTCLVTSEWASTVRIMFQNDKLKEQLQTKSLTFKRNSITCLHAGSYTCEGNNQHRKVSSAPIKLLVRCSPRPLRHAINNFTSSLHGSVTLSFTTLAYPEPGSSGFLWHKEDGIRWIALLSNTDLLISSSVLNSNLTIMNVSLQDFGQYRVTVTNDIGSYEHYLFLVEKDEHKQPKTTDICPLGRDETDLIVGISFGIVSAVLTVYSTIVTIALKRNRANRGSKIKEESTKQRTYINIAEGRTGRDTIGSGEDKDKSIEMYTDLARSSLDDKTTYDVIQRA